MIYAVRSFIKPFSCFFSLLGFLTVSFDANIALSVGLLVAALSVCDATAELETVHFEYISDIVYVFLCMRMCLPKYIYSYSSCCKAVNEFQVIYALGSPFFANFPSQANRPAQRAKANTIPNNVHRITIHRNRKTCRACQRCVGRFRSTRDIAVLWRFFCGISHIIDMFHRYHTCEIYMEKLWV